MNMRKFNTIAEQDEFTSKMLIDFVNTLNSDSPRVYVVTRDADGRANGFHDVGSEERVWVTYNSQKHCFHFSGIWPKSNIDNTCFAPRDLYNPQVSSPSINVSADKKPEQIVKDVMRRFMPEYSAILTRLEEKRDQHDRYITSSNTLASELGNILVGRVHGASGSKGPEQRHVDISQTGREFYGSAEVSGDNVSFNLRSVPADKARKLATFIATL